MGSVSVVSDSWQAVSFAVLTMCAVRKAANAAVCETIAIVLVFYFSW